MDKIEITFCNGYEIRYNCFYKKWQVSHKNIGACIEEYNTLKEAKENCLKG